MRHPRAATASKPSVVVSTDRTSACGAIGASRAAGASTDLTGMALSGHRQSLSVWALCLYFMGLNLSNAQIAQELDLNKDDVQAMTECLRDGPRQKKPP